MRLGPDFQPWRHPLYHVPLRLRGLKGKGESNMRTSDPEKIGPRGVYYITPPDKPEFSPPSNKASWWVIGFRVWDGTNSRIRRRWTSFEEAEAFLLMLERKDSEYLGKQAPVITPVVIATECLAEWRVREAQQALALLPLDSNNNPDPRCRLDEAIQFALKCGWNPTSSLS